MTKRGGTKSYYSNDNKRCCAITHRGRQRCTRQSKNGHNLCGQHISMRSNHMKEHEQLTRSRKSSSSKPSHQLYEYDYYLDEEIEPFDSNASRVVPKIWIGSIDSANDVDFLQQKGLKSIINASGMEPSINSRNMYKKLGVDYYTLSDIKKVPHRSHYRVSKYLGDERFSRGGLTPRKFFKYMHQGCQILNNKNFKFPVLINCHAGINRSGSLIAAYLLTKPRPYTYERTVELLEKANKKRGLDVLTNDDFKRALKYFPIFTGTQSRVSPQLLSRYNHYLKSYER